MNPLFNDGLWKTALGFFTAVCFLESVVRELYMESALFRKARRHVEKQLDDWFILSAKCGLLDPEGEEIEQYDETLRDAYADEKREWSRQNSSLKSI